MWHFYSIQVIPNGFREVLCKAYYGKSSVFFLLSGTFSAAYDGVYDSNFPTPVVENVYKAWKPVSYGHPLKDATMFYAPPSLERVVISGGLDTNTGNNIDRSDRGTRSVWNWYTK